MRELQRCFSRDSERAFRTDEQSQQIVAGHVDAASAQRNDLARRQNHLRRKDVIGRHPVLQTVGPTGVLGNVASNRARHLTRGVGRVVKTARRGRLGKVNVYHTSFDYSDTILIIDLEDLIEPCQLKDHGALKRDRTTRESRARAARCEWYVSIREDLDRGGYFFSGARNDHGRREVLMNS